MELIKTRWCNEMIRKHKVKEGDIVAHNFYKIRNTGGGVSNTGHPPRRIRNRSAI